MPSCPKIESRWFWPEFRARWRLLLVGSCGSAARQDVLVDTDADLFSENENDHAAWLAYRKAEKGQDFARKEASVGKKAKIEGGVMVRP